MVEAGIAEVVEEAIQHEAGLPTKYKLTRPEYLVFIDEMGYNTNQLNDGKVGGELFIMPKKCRRCCSTSRGNHKHPLYSSSIHLWNGRACILCNNLQK